MFLVSSSPQELSVNDFSPGFSLQGLRSVSGRLWQETTGFRGLSPRNTFFWMYLRLSLFSQMILAVVTFFISISCSAGIREKRGEWDTNISGQWWVGWKRAREIQKETKRERERMRSKSKKGMCFPYKKMLFLPGVKDPTWSLCSNQNLSPYLRLYIWIPMIQVKVGPTAAPGRGYSASPAEKRSISSTDL